MSEMESALEERVAKRIRRQLPQCPARDSGGVQCELENGHQKEGTPHFISSATIRAHLGGTA
jgi:hypothetical protein